MASEGWVAQRRRYRAENWRLVTEPRQGAMTKQEIGYLAVERMYEGSKHKCRELGTLIHPMK